MKHKQQGASLLELMLVMVISALFIVIAIRQYQVYRQYMNVKELKNNVNLLLRAGGYYYLSHCISDPGGTDSEIAQKYEDAQTYLGASPLRSEKRLALYSSHGSRSVLAVFLPMPLDQLTNPFNVETTPSTLGKRSGDFSVTLNAARFIANPDLAKSGNWRQNIRTYIAEDGSTSQGFNSRVLWQVNVRTCINTLGTNVNAIKNLFGADAAALDSSTCGKDGIALRWTRLARTGGEEETSYSMARASQAQYTKLYQWSPWLQTRYVNLGYADFYNYVCQT